MAENYELQTEKLAELEKMSQQGAIDLFYGDETHLCSESYVPYGWQFTDEKICCLTDKSYKFNCLGFINRQIRVCWQVTEQNIDTQFVMEFLEKFSFDIKRTTFVVLDNARIHKAKAMRKRIPYWQNRELFLFFLPHYSPHLNLAETLWRILKGKWIKPQDYISKDNLFYATDRALANVGKILFVNFKDHAA
jgi:transposase